MGQSQLSARETMNLNCLMIGGGGFIGRRLAKKLVSTGRRVVAIGRSIRPKLALPAGVTYVQCDYRSTATLQQLLGQADEVIDLAYATTPSTSYVDPVLDYQANLSASVRLFELSKSLKNIKRALIVSSGGTVYGKARQLPITEDHPTSPISPYGITKLAIEKYALMYQQNFGLPIVIARVANAYGFGQIPFSGQGFIATAIASILENRNICIYGTSGAIRDYVHVDDVAASLLCVLESGVLGCEYNIGTGIGSSNLDIIDLLRPLAESEGYETRIQFKDMRPFDIPANVLDSTRLFACSGWGSTIPIEDGIRRTWTNMLQERMEMAKVP